ncbi:MAG: cysteine--tRNA ligase, partial [Candidatus Aenigmarchaeota archaeon]|nr:cysteine--tRNA ligase [Candidatus Aenigmarchaeota archaeon]
VYNYAHIGNLRSFICADILKRWLIYKGFKVKHVMNITDVDDKTIRDSQKQNISLKEFTRKYEKAFFEDLNKLNIIKPDITPRATEHIDDMVSVIQTLLEKGYAYHGEDGSIYFSIKKFPDYGKLAGLDLDKLKPTAQISEDEYSKEDARDFALWKAWTEKDGDVYWETPLGKGRPGWHIECSTMSSKYLGIPFDIHTGGVDLIFPHHTNEIAQAEAATGKKFVNYWVHIEHLIVDNKKMSKSLGNFYTLRDLLEKGYSSKAIRYILMSTHYRKQLNFTLSGLEQAEKTVKGLLDFMHKIKTIELFGDYNQGFKVHLDELKKKFEEYMDDDLNMPQALAIVFEIIKETNKAIEEKHGDNDKLTSISTENLREVYKLMKEIDKVLGILEEEEEEIPKEIIDLAEKRQEARKKKDFETADKIREQIKSKGYLIEDTSSGYRIRKA